MIRPIDFIYRVDEWNLCQAINTRLPYVSHKDVTMSQDENVFKSDKQLAERYQVSRMTIWRWSKIGVLPKPHKFGGTTRWKLSEVEQHMVGGAK
jgi:prophage regulatory protein